MKQQSDPGATFLPHFLDQFTPDYNYLKITTQYSKLFFIFSSKFMSYNFFKMYLVPTLKNLKFVIVLIVYSIIFILFYT